MAEMRFKADPLFLRRHAVKLQYICLKSLFWISKKQNIHGYLKNLVWRTWLFAPSDKLSTRSSQVFFRSRWQWQNAFVYVVAMLVIHDLWFMICDLWFVNCELWIVNCELWIALVLIKLCFKMACLLGIAQASLALLSLRCAIARLKIKLFCSPA